jgi:hypothetical protein
LSSRLIAGRRRKKQEAFPGATPSQFLFFSLFIVFPFAQKKGRKMEAGMDRAVVQATYVHQQRSNAISGNVVGTLAKWA